MSDVLVIGDTHCPCMRKGYVDFLKRIADKYSISRVVHIGDLVDWSSISYHEKHPKIRNAREERKKALRQIRSLKKAFPQVTWLIGNHDALTERQCVTAGLLPELMVDYATMWEVDWTVIPRYGKWEFNGVLYSHGETGFSGMDAAFRQAKDNFQSTVIGHLHTQGGVKWWANQHYRIFGMSVATGIDHNMLQFEYGQKVTSKPLLGCGVVTSDRVGHFEPWLLHSKG